MTRKILLLSCVFAILLPTVVLAAERQGLTKKLVQLGWDMPTTHFLKEHHRSMQETTPFDGTMFEVRIDLGEGITYSSSSFWDATPWKAEWFEGPLADLKACHWTTFTDNFLRLNATPGTIAWGDDAGWKILCEKTEFCARFLKRAGMKGFAPDFESYGSEMFQYDSKTGLSFAETERLARQRGKEFLAAIAKEFPEAVILCLWLNSVNYRAGECEDPASSLEIEPYGLLPAFIDGMLDAAPPEMVLVDGCENGYFLNGEIEYDRVANQMISWTGPMMRLVAPENRAKYRQQVQAGFGFYLDMFSNPEGHKYYRGPKKDGTRLDRLSENLSAALAAADQYVWVYGEHFSWWGPGTPWETGIPGVTQTIRRIRHPLESARTFLADEKRLGTTVNLLENPSFEKLSGTSDSPEGWSFWQPNREPLGKGSWDETVGNGSAKICGAKRADFAQSLPVEEGERFYVAAEIKTEGKGYPTIEVRWQKGNDMRTRIDAIRRFEFRDGRAEGVVVVPSGPDRMYIELTARNQESEVDACWFDNAELYRIP